MRIVPFIQGLALTVTIVCAGGGGAYGQNAGVDLYANLAMSEARLQRFNNVPAPGSLTGGLNTSSTDALAATNPEICNVTKDQGCFKLGSPSQATNRQPIAFSDAKGGLTQALSSQQNMDMLSGIFASPVFNYLATIGFVDNGALGPLLGAVQFGQGQTQAAALTQQTNLQKANVLGPETKTAAQSLEACIAEIKAGSPGVSDADAQQTCLGTSSVINPSAATAPQQGRPLYSYHPNNPTNPANQQCQYTTAREDNCQYLADVIYLQDVCVDEQALGQAANSGDPGQAAQAKEDQERLKASVTAYKTFEGVYGTGKWCMTAGTGGTGATGATGSGVQTSHYQIIDSAYPHPVQELQETQVTGAQWIQEWHACDRFYKAMKLLFDRCQQWNSSVVVVPSIANAGGWSPTQASEVAPQDPVVGGTFNPNNPSGTQNLATRLDLDFLKFAGDLSVNGNEPFTAEGMLTPWWTLFQNTEGSRQAFSLTNSVIYNCSYLDPGEPVDPNATSGSTCGGQNSNKIFAYYRQQNDQNAANGLFGQGKPHRITRLVFFYANMVAHSFMYAHRDKAWQDITMRNGASSPDILDRAKQLIYRYATPEDLQRLQSDLNKFEKTMQRIRLLTEDVKNGLKVGSSGFGSGGRSSGAGGGGGIGRGG